NKWSFMSSSSDGNRIVTRAGGSSPPSYPRLTLRSKTFLHCAHALCRSNGEGFGGGPKPPPTTGLDLEHAPDLHREAHVTLELQLAGHEGHLPRQLPADHVEPVLRRHAEGQRRIGGGARRHRALPILDRRMPRAALVAADVVLDRRIDA